MSGRALLSLTIKPRTKADQERLARGVAMLMTEDPMMSANVDLASGEAVVAGIGELHLEIIVDRLTREFNVEASVSRPEVVYKETLTCAADGEGRFVRQQVGSGHYAHAKVHLYPGKTGSGYVFENDNASVTIPLEFIKAIDEGIKEALTGGVLAGYRVDDVRVVVYDGSYHDIDSSESAFKIAGSMAFHDAARKAKPVLLEPVMRVEVTTPNEYVAAVTTNLSTRRSEMLSPDDRGGVWRIRARVPLSETLGYAADLRAMTQGRATFTMEFAGYQPWTPEENQDADGDSIVGAPRKPTPTLRESRVALPEPSGEDGMD